MGTAAALAKLIATGRGWGFWEIGYEVYRAPNNAAMDTYGYPMGRRWECSLDQWLRYRRVFDWATDTTTS